MTLGTIGKGFVVPPLRKEPITRVTLAKYAAASGDFAPHHLDPDVARTQGLDDVVAHGMLSLTYIGQMLTNWAGAGSVRKLTGRFAALVHVGDVLTCRAVVTAVERAADGRRYAILDVWAENEHGEKVTYGQAEVYIELAATASGESAPDTRS